MRAQIQHTTEYRYPQPAWDSFNELRLQPADDDRQTLLGFRVEVEPGVQVRSHRDYFGTAVHHFHVVEAHTSLRVTTRASVLTFATPEPAPVEAGVLEALRHRFFEYLSPTERVPLGADWAARVGWRDLGERDDLAAYLDGLTRHLHANLRYTPGATTVSTPLAEFVAARAGVCQDYAHAMIAICRRAGVPARYVSGYVYAGSDFVGAEATHAWLECYLPGSGWLGWDPTNGSRVTEAHVKAGHGRDYDDVPPMKGLRRGGGLETLGVAVAVQSDDPIQAESAQ